MKILVCLVFSIFGFWINSFAQDEGMSRARYITFLLDQVPKEECKLLRLKLALKLGELAVAHPHDANQVSLEFEEHLKKLVAGGELSRECQDIILETIEKNGALGIRPKENNPSIIEKLKKGPIEPKESDSPQKAKTSPDEPATTPPPVTGKLADEIKKMGGLKEPAGSGKAAEGIKHGANSITPNRPITGPLSNAKRVTGTGNTTGHIADLTIDNPSNNVMEIEIPNMFIPSINDFQPYIVPAANSVVVPPNSEITIPIIGYCVDITKPPVPAGDNMPPISTWVEKDPELYDHTGIIPDKLYDYWGIPNPESGMSNTEDFPIKFINVTSETPGLGPFVYNHISTNPDSKDKDSNQKVPSNDFHTVVIPRENIDLAVPLLFDALEKITSTTDSLMQIGEIKTPFSGNVERERESIIQQTVWLYSSVLVGDPYEKEQFQDKLIEQYEKASGTDYKSAPVQLKENIEKGTDDFWNTFTLVGVEAKILSDKPSEFTPIPHKDKLEDAFGKHNPDQVKPHTDTVTEALDNVGAEAHAIGDHVHVGPSTEPNKDLIQSELAHDTQHKKSESINRMTSEDLARFENKLILDSQKPNKDKCPPPNIKITIVSLKGNEIIIQLPDGTDLDTELILAGTEIPENSTIATGDGTELIVKSMICRDGKWIDHIGYKVSENTEVRFDQVTFTHPNVVKKVQINHGEIRIKVTDDRKEYRMDMKVASPNATTSVSGTEFIARVTSNIEEILVIEGCVDVLKIDTIIGQKVCSGKKFIIK